MFYQQVFVVLQKHNVEYAVVGGVAVNLHGIPRMTADLDILVSLDRKNLEHLLAAMDELGYRPRLPVSAEDLLDPEKRRDWIANKNLHAFTFWNPQRSFEEVDVLLSASEDTSMIERADKLQIDAMIIHLVALDDLIELKRQAGRQQDQADIEALIKLKNL